MEGEVEGVGVGVGGGDTTTSAAVIELIFFYVWFSAINAIGYEKSTRLVFSHQRDRIRVVDCHTYQLARSAPSFTRALIRVQI